MRALRGLLLAAALPLLLGSRCKEEEPPGTTDVVAETEVQSPEVALQVASVRPSELDAGRAVRATIYGSGFEPGSRVFVGEAESGQVEVRDANAISALLPPLEAGVYDLAVLNTDGTRSVLRGAIKVREPRPTVDLSACQHVVVHFAFDSASLSAEALSQIDGVLSCLRAVEGDLVIEGHCDERGTTEYNLALGQRRAEAVRRYLVSQGIPPERMRTVSYGEERPLVRGSNEQAWAANRRVEIKVQP